MHRAFVPCELMPHAHRNVLELFWEPLFRAERVLHHRSAHPWPALRETSYFVEDCAWEDPLDLECC